MEPEYHDGPFLREAYGTRGCPIAKAGEIAKSHGKPLIVFKIATGEHGAAMALSHTGHL
jgi:hypothetical protein